jgi:putative spermidine/putrescine transport system substrate-binding protein
MRKSRLRILAYAATAASVALAFSLGTTAEAAKKYEGITIYLQNWGGPEGQMVDEYILAPFEEETGAKVVVDTGWTSASVAKLRAQKEDPKLDLVMFDDIGVVTAGREGLLVRLNEEEIPNLKDVPEKFVIEGNGVGFFNIINAIAYSKKHFERPPTSWSVLWDENLEGKVILPAIDSTSIFKVLIVAAQLNGGSLDDIEPGFDAMRQLKPNIHSMTKNLGLVAEPLHMGDAAVAAWRMDIMKEYIDRGYDIGVTSDLEEGIFASAGCIAIVKGHQAPREALNDLINRTLDPEVQAAIAKEYWQSPTNRKVKLPSELQGIVFHPESDVKVIDIDLIKFDENKQEMLERLNMVLMQ